MKAERREGTSALGQELRNALRRNVGRLREQLLLNGREQLESRYGIQPTTGDPLPDASIPHVLESPRLLRERGEILAAIDHELEQLRGKGRSRSRAVEMFLLQSAFTVLNRLAALKVMERRKLVPECLQKGDQSEGAKLFRQLSPGLSRDDGESVYRRFLELLFDDVAGEIRLLFDRTLPSSHLFPEGPTLTRVLELLNDPEIESAWDEDEVLGWVYQYFTPKELREKVRKESGAPRNTYELAIRNQFYTPDYVVRFLADNTLGRLWWEAHPESALKDLDYLVRRLGEEPSHREVMDVREIRVLDPACGSGHFLHYCFELLRTIYREAYESGHPAGAALRKEWPDREDFEREVPALILRENLFGIDIDLRAAQLTALSLYLRAKRAHPESPIRRVNAVIAAPMPGEEALRVDFLERVRREPQGALLVRVLEGVFEELDLAGEAGSLLRAEERLKEEIRSLQSDVEKARQGRQLGLNAILGDEYTQGELAIDEIPTDEFWGGIEKQLMTHLTRYVEEVTNNGVLRRLFADDAAHGVGFVDALMHSYDVVLMNPPFGAASTPSKKYVDSRYPRTKNDVYAAFVERGLQLLRPTGYLGAITSRTGFFLSSFQKWREEILLQETDVITFADLGYGVLDTAMVETAAYVLRKRKAEDEA